MIGMRAWSGAERGFGRDRRAAIALIAALAAPVVLISVAMGIEVAHWSAVQIETQRVADMAALAGGVAWVAYPGENPKAASPCQTPSQACVAAVAAADVAEVNGAVGTTTPSWTWNAAATIGTLSDSAVTVVVSTASAGAGLDHSADPMVKVTVQQSVPLGFGHLLKAAATETLGAAAIAEVTTTGPQPCLAALSPTGTGITYEGSTTVQATGCSIRSNAGITETGSGYWNTEGIYAAGTVSLPSYFGPGQVVDNNGNPITPQSNAGTIPDPYADNPTVQNALTQAANATGPSINCSTLYCGLPASSAESNNGSYCTPESNPPGVGTPATCTLMPGNYAGFNINGGGPFVFNLQPGLYVFNGNINLTSSPITINGTGVTIITTGTFTGSSSFDFNLTAPTPAQAADTGGIAGIALAGATTGAVTVSGDPNVQIGGVMYFPHASFSGSGSTSATGNASANCFELIAASITFSGYSGYAGDCPTMGATSFGSVNTAVLVQ